MKVLRARWDINWLFLRSQITQQERRGENAKMFVLPRVSERIARYIALHAESVPSSSTSPFVMDIWNAKQLFTALIPFTLAVTDSLIDHFWIIINFRARTIRQWPIVCAMCAFLSNKRRKKKSGRSIAILQFHCNISPNIIILFKNNFFLLPCRRIHSNAIQSTGV